MQNKGFVKLIAVALTLICCLYLAFTVKSRSFKAEVEQIAATEGQAAAEEYQEKTLDNEFFLLQKMRNVREMSLGFGLDLEGGMNVILEVSVSDVLKALSDNNDTDNFKAALKYASDENAKNGGDVINLFTEKFQELAGKDQLCTVFATQQLRDKINAKSTDEQVKEVLRSEVSSAIESSFNILTNRIDQFGVAQPNIQRLEGTEGGIMIELPGVKEPERVRKLLEGSANLEFWECADLQKAAAVLTEIDKILDSESAKEETVAEVTEVAETDTTATDSIAEKKGLDKVLATKKATADSTKVVKNFASLMDKSGMGTGSSVIACFPKQYRRTIDSLLAIPAVEQLLKAENISFKWGNKQITYVNENREEVKTGLYPLHAISTENSINGHANMEGDAIADASEAYKQGTSEPYVSMTMNPNGASDWARLTKANLKKPVAIVLDNIVYTAPTVQSEITGGQSEITGNFTPEEVRDLVNVLKSGRMPAPARITSCETIGPSLGAESINQGMWSCLIAFIILMLYMIAMYGVKPGMVANGALIMNLFFTVGILSSFQAALTMSGIAGMVLSLGMAVDANVLIYERTKEELKSGKRVQEALSAGYSNAFSAIFDSNLTSIITGIILFYFGTGPIRGFATTLIIGIIVSFFTAVFVTRVVFEGRMAKDKWLDITFTTPLASKFFQNPAYKFMSAWKTSFTIFAILAVTSVGFMLTRGFSKSIDFTGGRNYVVKFDQPTKASEVESILKATLTGEEVKTTAINLGTEGNKVRVTTNYRINEKGVEVDEEIENKMHAALTESKLITSDYQTFTNRNAKEEEKLGGSIISSQMVGNSIAAKITKGAFYSVILAFIAIFIYILIRFRNIAFSVGAITALILDIILILGMYSICWGWMPFSLEIDQTFIGAVLTAISYSINDKVVVFDRIREFIGLHPKRDKKELFNTSLNTTLTRTLNTSISTFIVLAVIFCLGGDSIRSFAFAMILGVVFGTLSSIFIAAPTAYLTMSKKAQKAEEKK